MSDRQTRPRAETPAPRRAAAPTLVGTPPPAAYAQRLRTLLVAPLGAPRDALKSALAPMPLELEVATDIRRVAEHLKAHPFDLLLAEVSCLTHADRELLSAVCKLERPPFVVALVERVSPREITDLLQAGVKEFVRLPLHIGELSIRLRDVKPLPPVARPAQWPGLEALPPILASDLAGLASTSFAVSKELTEDITDVVGATIALTHPKGNAELHLCVSMNRGVAEAAVKKVLGATPDHAMVAEFIAEIANLSAGAMKRCVATSGLSLTLGLPEHFEGPAPALAGEPDIAFDLVASAGLVRCVVTTRGATVLGLPLHALREGLVLARDVRSASGMLLLTAGVRLTNSTVERLQRSLEHAVQVEVVDAT